MAIDNLTKLLSQDDTRDKLLKLVDQQHQLNEAQKYLEWAIENLQDKIE